MIRVVTGTGRVIQVSRLPLSGRLGLFNASLQVLTSVIRTARRLLINGRVWLGTTSMTVSATRTGVTRTARRLPVIRINATGSGRVLV